jgi:hypothetical protein
MGWGSCGNDSQGRPIGYSWVAFCDHPGCINKINRGLAYACGGMHGEGGQHGDWGCDKYFCPEHLTFGRKDRLCLACALEEAEAHKIEVEDRLNRMRLALRKEG